jgi:hypothetical protein
MSRVSFIAARRRALLGREHPIKISIGRPCAGAFWACTLHRNAGMPLKALPVWASNRTLLLVLYRHRLRVTTDTLGEAVRNLVAKGVKPEDYGRALELLLRLSPVYPKQYGALNLPAWLVGVSTTMALIATLLSFQARTAFEIGKGAESVLRQKRYEWFLRKAIPAFFIFGVLASAVGSFVFETLRLK